MKRLLTAAALLAVVACGPKNTRLTGHFAPDSMAAEAQIIVGEQIDTTVEVIDGTFTLEIPANTKVLSYAVADEQQLVFVSDGTPIKLDFETGKAISSCKKGVNARFEKYMDWTEDFMTDFQEKMDGATEEEQEKIYAQALEEYNEYVLATANKNLDNVLGLVAATSVQLDDDDEMLELLNSLSDDLKQDPGVQAMIKAYDASALTAEGMMFTDFETPDGDKLSDYVGQGKYILVDFWASWCGPCRREIPNLKAVYDEFHGADFDLLSVAVWDDPEATKKAAEEEQIPWNQIINAQKIPTDLYGIQGIPHIILFGPDGTILKRGLRGDDIRTAVAQALDR